MPYVRREDLDILLDAADGLARCEMCGAFLTDDERAPVEDFTGCWYAATEREQDKPTCKRHRVPLMRRSN
jgi:hypothetical protein